MEVTNIYLFFSIFGFSLIERGYFLAYIINRDLYIGDIFWQVPIVWNISFDILYKLTSKQLYINHCVLKFYNKKLHYNNGILILWIRKIVNFFYCIIES